MAELKGKLGVLFGCWFVFFLMEGRMALIGHRPILPNFPTGQEVGHSDRPGRASTACRVCPVRDWSKVLRCCMNVS